MNWRAPRPRDLESNGAFLLRVVESLEAHVNALPAKRQTAPDLRPGLDAAFSVVTLRHPTLGDLHMARTAHGAPQDAYREGVDMSVTALRAMAARIRATAKGCPYATSNAGTLEQAAEAIQPAQPRARCPAGGDCLPGCRAMHAGPCARACACGCRQHGIECDKEPRP